MHLGVAGKRGYLHIYCTHAVFCSDVPCRPKTSLGNQQITQGGWGTGSAEGRALVMGRWGVLSLKDCRDKSTVRACGSWISGMTELKRPEDCGCCSLARIKAHILSVRWVAQSIIRSIFTFTEEPLH